LLHHEYFNEFRDWFEDEIQTLLEYDQQEAMANMHQTRNKMEHRRTDTDDVPSRSLNNPFYSNKF